jgi:hypothetical protein
LPFFAHFEIDIVSALADQLLISFEALDIGGLSEENIGTVPIEQGVYQLFRNGALVYVGKADKLRSRLSEHRFKILGRRNIAIGEMGFKCLTVHKNWTAVAPESSLISHYKAQAGICEWNGNGFGPHDPGRHREETNQSPEGFDTQFPIREDWPCSGIDTGDWNARDLLIKMKDELPFLLRYQTTDKKKYRSGHPDYNNLTITVPEPAMPAEELLRLIAQNVPGWQATRFPGSLIFYKEHRTYTFGTVIWPPIS